MGEWSINLLANWVTAHIKDIFTIVSLILSCVAIFYARKASKQVVLTEKKMKQARVKNLINYVLTPLLGTLKINEHRLKDCDHFLWWSYHSQKFTSSGVDDPQLTKQGQIILQSFDEEKPIRIIGNKVKVYVEKVQNFKELLESIVESVRSGLGFTIIEICDSEVKWRYVQWIVGRAIQTPSETLEKFHEKHLSKIKVQTDLNQMKKDILKRRSGDSIQQEEIKIIQDLSEISNKIVKLSRELRDYTREIIDKIERTREKYAKEYYIPIEEYLPQEKPGSRLF